MVIIYALVVSFTSICIASVSVCVTLRAIQSMPLHTC
jgi:hypothetical protein